MTARILFVMTLLATAVLGFSGETNSVVYSKQRLSISGNLNFGPLYNNRYETFPSHSVVALQYLIRILPVIEAGLSSSYGTAHNMSYDTHDNKFDEFYNSISLYGNLRFSFLKHNDILSGPFINLRAGYQWNLATYPTLVNKNGLAIGADAGWSFWLSDTPFFIEPSVSCQLNSSGNYNFSANLGFGIIMDHYTNQEIRYTPAEEAYRDPGYILTAMADFTLYIPSGIELTLEKDIMEHLCWNINAGIRYGFSPRMADGGPTIWPWLTAGLRGYIFERSGLFLGAEAGIQGAYLMPAPMLAAEIGWRLNITKEISAEALVQGELIWMTLNPKIGVSYRF